ncbi:unnamed protein product [Pleuronectes platessa]|uniref:Uncharacterized protein n=1 Tax=Pleuronectes platessa TaxID=8262 RepID=A0A9N7YLC5_PLEPL|nr:unnamed protein product [Pleuronectes platessa]
MHEALCSTGRAGSQGAAVSERVVQGQHVASLRATLSDGIITHQREAQSKFAVDTFSHVVGKLKKDGERKRQTGRTSPSWLIFTSDEGTSPVMLLSRLFGKSLHGFRG